MENMQCQVLNMQRVQALEAWLKTTNTNLTQVNGQRKYGGPPEVWDGPPPGVRCEVFISKIPRDTYEDLLIPLFSSVGELWEFRLMMNFSGQNRGFAYAKYGTAAMASDAIRLLNGYMLEPGSHLSVRRSTEKKKLFIGDLPAVTKQEELLQVLRVLVEGVERVSLKAGVGIEGVSAIVAFSSHHAASMAKKVLLEEFKKKFSLNVSIKWHSVEKVNLEDPPCPQKAPSILLPSSLKPPSALPPHLAPSPSVPPGFCRAVGGPTAPKLPYPRHSSPSSSQGKMVLAGCPVLLLQKMCEANGFGQPGYEMFYSHAGSDGFLYFNYKLHIHGAPTTFEGLVMILPGPSASNMLKEAERAAAQQVLQRRGRR
ncbi:dead end protein 1 isoform X2 [Melanotaenia boesemani]|uniref:dead end protein 1 isoform X2 n=1 Tax=Melanotaenia boesemani TaxID=1250792 RepID=UPI001C0498E2|nr:dead end protein 1 isoform X2 [Melanotaenia boesemani]